MSQDRSVINIDFNVEEYVEDGMQFLKPPNQPPTNAMVRRKRDRRLLSPVPTRQINELVSGQINHRVKELKTFRKDSQSALQSPLLVTAIIKKTAERLERIEVGQTIFVFIYINKVLSMLVTRHVRDPALFSDDLSW